MPNPISETGYRSTLFVQTLGSMAAFASNVVAAVARPPFRLRSMTNELYNVGVLSLLITIVSGIAVGMVIALQGYHVLLRYGAERSLGAVVGIALVRELGPVVAALLFVGRAGSATAAHIGHMVATEQLDGLRMQSIDPLHFVVTPKVLAMFIAVPLLTAIFITCGCFGGYFAGVVILNGDAGSYLSSLENSVDRMDMIGCFIKSGVFGILVAIIATYRGYIAKPTADGVSEATTSTVVFGCVTVLLSDYIVTALWGV